MCQNLRLGHDPTLVTYVVKPILAGMGPLFNKHSGAMFVTAVASALSPNEEDGPRCLVALFLPRRLASGLGILPKQSRELCCSCALPD